MLILENTHSTMIVPVIRFIITPLLIMLFLAAFSANAYQSPRFGFFVKNEVNDNDYISGIGAEMWLSNRNSNFGMSVLSSIGKAEVTDRDNIQHDYLAWEAGLKLGYFSDVFAYAEVGFDVGELAFQDRNEDDNYHANYGSENNDFVSVNRKRYDDANNIDGYVGVGAGIKFEHLQVEAFARLRQVDGEYWKADNQAFTGAKLSVIF